MPTGKSYPPKKASDKAKSRPLKTLKPGPKKGGPKGISPNRRRATRSR